MEHLSETRLVGAVVGCGRMGANTSDVMRRFAPPSWLPLSHCEAMATHSRVSLEAVCDVDTDAAARAQSRYGARCAFQDYRRLIDEISPDLLCIATRTRERPEIIGYALERGIRAMHLEKPLCNSVAQLRVLEQALSRPAVACTYGTLRRYLPVYKHARELATSGRFGTLQQIEVCFGPAPLLWTHPHSLDIMLFMAGDATASRVWARVLEPSFEARGASIDGDPIVRAALVEFESGVTGLISQTGGGDVVLSCSGGTVAVEADGHRIRVREPLGEDPYWRDASEAPGMASDPGGIRFALDRLIDALGDAGSRQAAEDKRAIVAGQRLVFACAQSHLAGGTACDPSQLDPDLTINGRTNDRYA